LITALIDLGVSAVQVVMAFQNSGTFTQIITWLLQLLLAPAILWLSGAILILHGWRLDLVLLFQQLIMTEFLIDLIIKELKLELSQL